MVIIEPILIVTIGSLGWFLLTAATLELADIARFVPINGQQPKILCTQLGETRRSNAMEQWTACSKYPRPAGHAVWHLGHSAAA